MKNCRLKDCRLQISAVLTAAFSVFCLTAVYANQTKPAAPAAKPAAPAVKATPATPAPAPPSPAAPASNPPPPSIATGETLYKRQCQTCHGATGVGDGPA